MSNRLPTQLRDKFFEPCLVISGKNQILDLNKAAALFFELPKKQLLTTDLLSLKNPLFSKRLISKIQHRLAKNNNIPIHLEQQVLGNKFFSVNVYNLPKVIVIHFYDITNLKLNDARIKESEKRLAKQKDEFIAIASHELKTPITVLKGYLEILELKFSKTTDAKTYLEKMDRELVRLTDLVDDLLDVAKIGTRKLQLNLSQGRLDKLIKDITTDLSQTSHHQLIVNIQSTKKISFDEFRVRQVLINLINNAIKYSPRADRVLITLSQKEHSLIVMVEDFGIGISNKEIMHVFKPFYQVKNRIRSSYSGLGLGLYISREIIHRHGGKMWVESEKGRGSRFLFSLPIKRA